MNEFIRVMVIAGETSGDMHGAQVIRSLKRKIPGAEIFGMGGDSLANEGMEILYHIRDSSFMGFAEIVRHYPRIKKIFDHCVRLLTERKPDVILLIDYPGFNLRLAEQATNIGIPVQYYISPQVWAWGKKRIDKMKRFTDRLAVILPFEESLYRNAGVDATFVGHPLLEILPFDKSRKEFLDENHLPDKHILALLPGSRKQEINLLLPPLLEAAEIIRARTDCIVAVGAAPGIPDAMYTDILGARKEIHLVHDATHCLMQHARAAIVTSGTATLETAIYRTPMVIVYKTSSLTYHIAKRLVLVSHIGLVNILAGREIVPEFIQSDVTPIKLSQAIEPIILDDLRYEEYRLRLSEIRGMLGSVGASERVAGMMLELYAMKQRKNHV